MIVASGRGVPVDAVMRTTGKIIAPLPTSWPGGPGCQQVDTWSKHNYRDANPTPHVLDGIRDQNVFRGGLNVDPASSKSDRDPDPGIRRTKVPVTARAVAHSYRRPQHPSAFGVRHE